MHFSPVDKALLKRADRASLRAIALFELSKGLLVLIAGIGMLYFRHHDLLQFTLDLIRHIRLDPASRLAAYVARMAKHAQTVDPRLFALLAVGYASIRAAEARGLWLDRTWGNWIGALSGGLYLPFEAIELFHHPHWALVLLIIANLAIVLFLIHHLRRQCHPV